MNNVNNSHILVLVYFLVFWFFFLLHKLVKQTIMIKESANQI